MVHASLTGKSLVIGYKPVTYYGRPLAKVATLNESKKYRCLILHVDIENPDSVVGPKVQQIVQGALKFDIHEIRKITMKNHEVYIPFEVIDTLEKMDDVKGLIGEVYRGASKSGYWLLRYI